MKTNFDKLIREIKKFESKAGFEKTSKKELIKWLKEEIKNYENSKSKKVRKNKLIDAIVLIIQLVIRENVSLDDAWKKWYKKSEKYL